MSAGAWVVIVAFVVPFGILAWNMAVLTSIEVWHAIKGKK